LWYAANEPKAYGDWFNKFSKEYCGQVDPTTTNHAGKVVANPAHHKDIWYDSKTAAEFSTFTTKVNDYITKYMKTNASSNCKYGTEKVWKTIGNNCIDSLHDPYLADSCTGKTNDVFYGNGADSDWMYKSGGAWKHEKYHWTDLN